MSCSTSGSRTTHRQTRRTPQSSEASPEGQRRRILIGSQRDPAAYLAQPRKSKAPVVSPEAKPKRPRNEASSKSPAAAAHTEQVARPQRQQVKEAPAAAMQTPRADAAAPPMAPPTQPTTPSNPAAVPPPHRRHLPPRRRHLPPRRPRLPQCKNLRQPRKRRPRNPSLQRQQNRRKRRPSRRRRPSACLPQTFAKSSRLIWRRNSPRRSVKAPSTICWQAAMLQQPKVDWSPTRNTPAVLSPSAARMSSSNSAVASRGSHPCGSSFAAGTRRHG